MDPKLKHVLDAVPIAAGVVVAIGEAVLGVIQTSPGIVTPLAVIFALRVAVAVANVLTTPPKA